MVKCADCGYLTKPRENIKDRFPEVSAQDREWGVRYPICYRNEHDIQWEYLERIVKLPDYDPEAEPEEILLKHEPNLVSIGRDILNEERKCDEFIRYQPNNDPVWHKAEAGRLADRKIAARQVWINWIALIVAVLLILATLGAPLLPYWTGWAR